MRRDGDYIPFVDSGSYPIRAGNLVRPLVDGEPAFRRICEAVESAEHSVWVTVAFHHDGFQMPDSRGSLFDVLDAAVDRGVDVRAIFWRHPDLVKLNPGVHFAGTEEEREMLAARGSRFQARWDRAHGRYCQHQKSWLIDAGQPNEIAFVGGINLDHGSVVPVGHAATEAGNTHDVYSEVQGPAASDVHHNFVQRWNEASDRDLSDGLWPDASSQSQLEFPSNASAERGEAAVQIQRTVRQGRYTDGRPAVGARPFDIEGGEHSILDQYRKALAAARSSIYLEDQALGTAEIVEDLHAALERGVEVVFVAPADPNSEMAAGRQNPESSAFFKRMGELGDHENFALVGLASHRGRNDYQHVYVHAKIALVDDVWATIGSTNIGNRSFYGDTELNASFWHGPTVRSLRQQLFAEHIGVDTAGLDDRAALRLFRQVARENLDRRSAGSPLQGLAFTMDPRTYAS